MAVNAGMQHFDNEELLGIFTDNDVVEGITISAKRQEIEIYYDKYMISDG